LDVGANCGGFLKVAEELGYDAVGIEPSAWAAQYAREVLGQNVIEGTVKNLPSHMTDFDIVTMWDVLEHMKAPLEELLRIHSRLRPDGLLIFSTLDIANWFPRIMGRRWPWLMDMHLYYFTQSTVKQILARAGFRFILSRRYCHVITLDYLISKLVYMGVPGARFLKTTVRRLRLSEFYISFMFGDIKLYVARKGLP
jgi:SAM-dependent methyltransferase